jgi:hypothetical protein
MVELTMHEMLVPRASKATLIEELVQDGISLAQAPRRGSNS